VLTLLVNILARWFVRRGTRGMRAPETDSGDAASASVASAGVA
jgi:hypothetical protein